MKYVHYNFPVPEVVSSNTMFYLTVGSKPNTIQFTIIYDKGKQQILTFEISHLSGKNAKQLSYYQNNKVRKTEKVTRIVFIHRCISLLRDLLS